jgi:acyl carrier protein
LSLEVAALSDEIDETVRSVVAGHGRLAVDVGSLRDDEDLYRLGMTSHANVNVMLALEEAFDIEFPEEMLRRATFESLRAIRASVSILVDERLPA